MTETINGVVVVHFDEAGEISYHVTGAVRLVIVDDRAPNDRVYEYTTRTPMANINALFRGEQIGSAHDERHAAVEARINAMFEGKPHLSVVRGGGEHG